MNRQVLAAQALTLSRSILQQVPVHIRIASLARGFLRQALNRDDIYLAIGLEALLAMEKADIQGVFEGKTIAELRPYIKRNVLSKLKNTALALGGKIFNSSMARKVSLPVTEEAWNYTSRMLERHPLQSDKEIGAVIKYIAQGLTLRIQDVLKVQRTHGRAESDPDFAESTSGGREHAPNEIALWKEVERRFKSDPELLGPKGEPWAWIYIEGKAGGMTEAQIMDQWNEASRRSGGDVEWTRSSFLHWLRQRKSVMQELAGKFLDEGTLARIKLAVARGALRTAFLQPFERDLLELLAA